MTVRPIVYIPDPVLRQVCTPVPSVTADIQTLLDDMVDTMGDAKGLGLAAPQVGETCRVLVMAIPDNDDIDSEGIDSEGGGSKIYKMVNPEITWTSNDENTYEEGCLSIPEGSAEVIRPAEVKVSYLDENGKNCDVHCTGLTATCVQHEIDHLNGVLYFDHISKLKRDMIKKKTAKWIKAQKE